MSSFVQNQAREQVRILLEPTGNIFVLLRELDLIALDTSPEIQQTCIFYHDTLNTLQARAQDADGEDFSTLRSELIQFEKACSDLKQKHTIQLRGLQHTSHSLWQEFLWLLHKLYESVARTPRMEYDISAIDHRFQRLIDFYPPMGASYTDLIAFINELKPVFIDAKKDKVQLERLWNDFVTARNRAEQPLSELSYFLHLYETRSRHMWTWTQREYERVLSAARHSHLKLQRELVQLEQQNIAIPQAISLCQQIEKRATVELKDIISELDAIQFQQQKLHSRYATLIENNEATSLFHIPPISRDLIRRCCVLATEAESEDHAEMYLHVAQQVMEQKIAAEEALQIMRKDISLRVDPFPPKDMDIYIPERDRYAEWITRRNDTPNISQKHYDTVNTSSVNNKGQIKPLDRESKTEISAEEVSFTAYHPKEGKTELWHTLLVYTHLSSALANVQADSKRFLDQIAPVKTSTTSAFAELARDVEITIVPICENVTFNPPSICFAWLEDFHRAEFRYLADKSLAGDAARGQIDIYAGPFMIGCLKFVMMLTDSSSSQALDCEEHAKMFSRDDIFISYSRKDSVVARAFKDILDASGFDVFLDVDSLRSGQDWQKEIRRRIESAKIFQIFWSQNYSDSENCRFEWEYALEQNRETGYIRPVFWRDPLAPKPPPELSRFNFKFVKLNVPTS